MWNITFVIKEILMDTEFTYYNGEMPMIGGVLKDNNVAAPGVDLNARFIRYNGSYEQVLGDEKFIEDTITTGAYSLVIDSNKYYGPIRVRLFIKENGNEIIVGEDCIYINGKHL